MRGDRVTGAGWTRLTVLKGGARGGGGGGGGDGGGGEGEWAAEGGGCGGVGRVGVATGMEVLQKCGPWFGSLSKAFLVLR